MEMLPGLRQGLAVAAELETACALIEGARGGKASTQDKRATSKEIWERAMRELRVPPEDWYAPSAENFSRFAGWTLVRLRRQDLDCFSGMLNVVGPSRWWYRNTVVIEIKAAYLELFEEYHPPVGDGRKRVCIADGAIRRMVEKAEALQQDADLAQGGVEWTELGVITWVLLSILFAVRASTLGGMKGAYDVWMAHGVSWPRRDGRQTNENVLSLRVRFLKHWRGGRQRSTGRRLPIERTGRDGVPIPAQGWRARASAIIMAAVANGAVDWFGRQNPLREPTEAATIWNAQLDRFGWRTGDDHAGTNTSHSGRLTGVSVASALGVPVQTTREWMMVVADQTAERYVRRDYVGGEVGYDLMRFLGEKA
jgi:hypothetical protein